MGWKNLGEKPVVDTPWFRLNLAAAVTAAALMLLRDRGTGGT